MIYFYYNDLMQPSDHLVKSEEVDQLADIAYENFRESLDKKHGYQFNALVNILNLENIKYEVKEGFDCNSKDKNIRNFKKISFVFNKPKDIDSIIKKYGLDGVFDITKDKKIYTFISKDQTLKVKVDLIEE